MGWSLSPEQACLIGRYRPGAPALDYSEWLLSVVVVWRVLSDGGRSGAVFVAAVVVVVAVTGSGCKSGCNSGNRVSDSGAQVPASAKRWRAVQLAAPRVPVPVPVPSAR